MLCKNFKNLLIIFILATTAGCSTSNYKSNKDPNFSGPVKNMALLEKMIPAPFNNSFNTNFISTINSCGTKVTQFSTPNITGKFDSILSIDTVSFSKNGYGVPLSYNYEFTLIDSRGQKVWKA